MPKINGQKVKFRDITVDFDYEGRKFRDINITQILTFEDRHYHGLTRFEFFKYFGRFSNRANNPLFFYRVSSDDTIILSDDLFTFKHNGNVLTREDISEMEQTQTEENEIDGDVVQSSETDAGNSENNNSADNSETATTEEIPVEEISNEQTLSMITPSSVQDENDPKESISVLKVKNYKTVGEENYSDNNYIRVRLLANKKQVLVKIKDLKTVGVDESNNSVFTSLNSESLISHVGNHLIVKLDGVDYETEALTLDQATTRYETIKSYEISRSATPTEDTYIRTATGQFVKEFEAFQPISYKFVTDPDASFSHYMFTVGSDSNKKCVIVSEKFVKGFSGDTVRIDGELIPKANGRRLVSCKFSECDVVQTSTGGKDYDSCEITTKDPANPRMNKTEDLEQKRQKCLDLYKSGNYEINSTYLPGSDEPIGIDTKKRFEYTDEHIVDDRTADLDNYRNTNFEPLKYIYDGKKIKFSSGPKYDAKKGIKNSFKDLGKVFGYSLAALCSPLGMLALVAAPVLLSAYFGAMIVALPLIPIVHGIKALAQRVVKNFKDKVKYNRKNTNVAEKATTLISKVQNELNKAHKVGLTDENRECMFNSAMNTFNVLEQELMMNGNAHYDSAFVMRNGVGQVTAENAQFAGKFARETNSKIRQKARLERAHKKYEKLSNQGKDISERLAKKEEKYDLLGRDIEARTTNYIAENNDYKETKDYQKQKLALKIAKNLTLMKINPWAFGLSEEKIGVNSEEIQKILNKMKIDVNVLASKDLVSAVGNVASKHPIIVKRLLNIARTANIEPELEAIPHIDDVELTPLDASVPAGQTSDETGAEREVTEEITDEQSLTV